MSPRASLGRRIGGILGNTEMRAREILAIGIGGKDASKMCLTKNDKIVKTFSPDRAEMGYACNT
jgi:hypothetical protein